MPPVVVAVAAAVDFIAGGALAWGTAMAIAEGVLFTAGSLAFGMLSKALIKAPKMNGIDTANHQLTMRQAVAPWDVIYGQVRKGGIITYLGVSGTNSEYLDIVITVAVHKVNAIQNTYPDGVLASDSSSNTVAPYIGFATVVKDFGDPANASQPFPTLVTNSGGIWSSSCLQRGRTKVYVRLKWDATVFPNGVPNITFDVNGKECYDPRVSAVRFVANPAIEIRDYLTDSNYGVGADPSEINDATFIAAANVCDGAVSLAAGGTERRYDGMGTFDTSLKAGDVLNNLCSAMAGYLVYSGGQWCCYAGAWRGVENDQATGQPITITDDDLRGPIQVQSRFSHRDTCNGVKGTFVSPTNNWQPAIFHPM